MNITLQDWYSDEKIDYGKNLLISIGKIWLDTKKARLLNRWWFSEYSALFFIYEKCVYVRARVLTRARTFLFASEKSGYHAWC